MIVDAGMTPQGNRPAVMSKPNVIQIRMGGYGPASTGFSKALQFIGDRLSAEFGDQLDIKYVWNLSLIHI